MNRRSHKLAAGVIAATLLISPASAADRPNVIVIMTDDQGTADLGPPVRLTSKRRILTHLPGAAFDSVSSMPRRRSARRRGRGCSPAVTLSVRACPRTPPLKRGSPACPPGRSRSPRCSDRPDTRPATSASGIWVSAPKPCRWGRASTVSFGHMGGCIDNYSHFMYWSGPNRHDLFRDGREIQLPGKFFGDLMVEEARGFLERNRDRPFFLYFAINAPHYPLQGDAEWLARYAGLKHPRNLYAAFLRTMDERIGRLLEKVDSLGLQDRTIVIVQSDHGHSTEERAFWGGGSAGIYRGAKFSLFEGGIRVPAIMSWPGHLPQNEVRSQVAYGCDWLPTIAELCGVNLPAVMLDGKSLAAMVSDANVPSPHKVLHWQIGKSWAVREGDWKLLVNVEDTTVRSPGTVIPGPFLVNLNAIRPRKPISRLRGPRLSLA